MKQLVLGKSSVFAYAVVVLCVVFCFSANVQAAQDFKGTTIRIITFDAPSASGAMLKMKPIIKEKTGINLEVETLPVPNMYEKEVLAATGKTGQWDIYCYDNAWGAEFSVPGWLVDLEPYLKKDPDAIKIDDFISTFRDAFRHPQTGNQYGVPWYADCQLVFYRTDLFNDPQNKKKFQEMFGRELSVPTTNIEFIEVAKFFTKKYNPDSPTEYGTSDCRDRGLCGFCAFLEALYSLKGDVLLGQPPAKLAQIPFDDSVVNMPALDSAEAVEAIKEFQYLSSPDLGIMPPGTTTYSFFETLADFEQGKVALGTYWSIMAPRFEDPSVSKIVGKVGTAPGLIYLPVFDDSISGGARSSRVGGWGLGISADCENKDAAWEVLKLLTGYNVAKQMVDFGLEPPRHSIYGDSELQKTHPWYKDTLVSMETARPVPLYPFYKKIELTIMRRLSAVAGDAKLDPKGQILEANKELTKVVKKKGLVK